MLIKRSSHTCNTCWLVDGTDDQGHHLGLQSHSFTHPPFLHPPASLPPFSRQLNSLHKCFVGGTSGCCCQGAFDLISVMHRENKKKKQGKTTTCLEVRMEPRSGRGGHLSPQGRVDVCTQWGHEDTPVLHRLRGEETQLEYINEWSIFSPPARHFPHPSAAAPLWVTMV